MAERREPVSARARDLLAIVGPAIAARTRGGVNLSSEFLLEQALAVTMLAGGDFRVIRAANRLAKNSDPGVAVMLRLTLSVAEGVCERNAAERPRRDH